MTTKRNLIEAAHSEIGLGDYIFDIPAEQLQIACRRLDAMMAEWNGMGLRLAWPIPASYDAGELDTETSLPDSAWEAVVTNLAIRLAPSFGKQVMQETKSAADRALTMLLGKVLPPKQQLGRIVAGAGNKPWRWQLDPFLVPEIDPLQAGPDSDLEFN